MTVYNKRTLFVEESDQELEGIKLEMSDTNRYFFVSIAFSGIVIVNAKCPWDITADYPQRCFSIFKNAIWFLACPFPIKSSKNYL